MTSPTPTRAGILAAHVRTLGDDDLNDLLVELPPEWFATLVDVALAVPVHPRGLVFRYQPLPAATATAAGGDLAARWAVLACGPRRRLGTITRDQPATGSAPAWRAWTRHGEPVTDGVGWAWPRRVDAAAALAWVTPASGARAMALAAHVRALPDDDLGDVLVELPRARFDALLEAAFPDAAEQGAAA
jgi:hypothetical protein